MSTIYSFKHQKYALTNKWDNYLDSTFIIVIIWSYELILYNNFRHESKPPKQTEEVTYVFNVEDSPGHARKPQSFEQKLQSTREGREKSVWRKGNYFLTSPSITMVVTSFVVSCLYLQTVNTPGFEVIKLEFILRLKIKRNDWLLADTCPQAANHCTLF